MKSPCLGRPQREALLGVSLLGITAILGSKNASGRLDWVTAPDRTHHGPPCRDSVQQSADAVAGSRGAQISAAQVGARPLFTPRVPSIDTLSESLDVLLVCHFKACAATPPVNAALASSRLSATPARAVLRPQRIVINPHTEQIKKTDANHCGCPPNEDPLRYLVKPALGLFFLVTHLPLQCRRDPSRVRSWH